MNLLALIIDSFIKACKVPLDTKVYPSDFINDWYYSCEEDPND